MYWQGPVECSLCCGHQLSLIEVPDGVREPLVPLECRTCGGMTCRPCDEGRLVDDPFAPPPLPPDPPRTAFPDPPGFWAFCFLLGVVCGALIGSIVTLFVRSSYVG